MPDRLIRITTALVVVGVAVVAAVVSYEHAYALVRAHAEHGWTARLVPLTVDGLVYASSMVMLQSAKRGTSVPSLALWLLALGILAILAANVMHGLDGGPIGAVVAAWPAIALVGSYELLMTLVRSSSRVSGHIPVPDPYRYRRQTHSHTNSSRGASRLSGLSAQRCMWASHGHRRSRRTWQPSPRTERPGRSMLMPGR